MSLYDILSLSAPADEVLTMGHSLAIDQSSMTGESKILCFIYFLLTKLLVHKDHKTPFFFMSGCKVADGVGLMQV
ncbi:hypothetical protein JHK82_033356 [Glycine max]|uniref:Uncharacterized protein n=2 Tax=Glycine subgen. Soja TaxID=1462606 RepID=K7LU23_SOYBN|nr:hypothetical protein JHK87_033295 [Glycine soja]KAG4980118.1 hypothetical protein JHK85_034076 [Glycine max]KAG5118936.1 hypothetical protein JHK82_033356 [Glycine max]KAG5139930.1 hypothetical protein JHK84_033698 [Glycine max]RZB75249.1 Calcium-transporting ATPase 9, plasma membrane-type [Glycine soja]